TCPPRARSRCSASSTAPTTTGGTLSIPPRHRPSASVLVACRYRFPARPSRFASALVDGLRCDCRSLVGCGFGCAPPPRGGGGGATRLPHDEVGVTCACL